ncbi:hypothetical protein Halru_3019 [Halovivax ruber XH-70]|uniref:Uncharacterized protein n=1 Tax=Halovivax ruber (strain DSM 18193 / JCM 13892 / XH-70) TaxID=797302 RepID=L0IDE6_HALRX|nr:hypothetical protein [Halovivax ruber]AGB17585.1 hypothetical protein Halru_3019 [Halovivax ruber XH-70]
MTSEQMSTREEPLILHCFADYGTESEVLSDFGNVIRVGIDPKDTNESTPIKADAHIEDKGWDLPIDDDVSFDLGLFHPVCSRWAATTSISGNPDEHENMIPSARMLAEKYCDHHIIENVPRAPLDDPIVLNGRMFGMPIKYERAFETSFSVPQPPREKRLLTTDGPSDKAETSSFFFSERSKEWWAAVKNYSPMPYPKGHVAKNAIPAPFIYYLVRLWLMVYEDEHGISEGRVDYSDYDKRMDTKRKSEDNRQLDDFH